MQGNRRWANQEFSRSYLWCSILATLTQKPLAVGAAGARATKVDSIAYSIVANPWCPSQSRFSGHVARAKSYRHAVERRAAWRLCLFGRNVPTEKM